jgi:hypothetical protein
MAEDTREVGGDAAANGTDIPRLMEASGTWGQSEMGWSLMEKGNGGHGGWQRQAQRGTGTRAESRLVTSDLEW